MISIVWKSSKLEIFAQLFNDLWDQEESEAVEEREAMGGGHSRENRSISKKVRGFRNGDPACAG
jgi:hypothetical protein